MDPDGPSPPTNARSPIATAVRAFFRENDRFPKWMVVGLDAYEGYIAFCREERVFTNYRTLNTVFGERQGVEGPHKCVLIPSAYIGADAVGEPESIILS